jgi:cytochrome P450
MTQLPPGPAGSSFRHLLRWIRNPIGLMEEGARDFGDCFTVRFPSLPWLAPNPPIVFFSDPAAVREIFTADNDRAHAGEANVDLAPLLGEHSLLLLDGPRHLRERRLMQPPFHGERMLAYGRVMQETTDLVVAGWPIGRPFPVRPEMQRITLDVIMRTVFGVTKGLDGLGAALTRLLDAGTNPLAMLVPLELGGLTPRGRFARVAREVDAALFAEIARRRAGEGLGDDILSILVAARDEAGEPMSDAELRDEMITLLVAGYETTATALAWAFHRILSTPAVLERIQAEIAEVVGDGPVRPEHVSRLAFVDATAKETLRLNPVVPLVGRVLKAPMRIGGVDLPEGVVAAPCIYLAHRRSDVYPDPERFDPERFLGKPANPYTFFPFGGGVRRCIGMAFALYEMKIVLASILARVTLRAAPGTRVTVVPKTFLFAPSGGMPVVVDRRAA